MLADYYSRGAVAAAQVIAGFDEDRFRDQLVSTPVGISIGRDTTESEATLDLLVRLLARLYPKLAISGGGPGRDRALALASEINPKLEIVEEAAIGVVVADGPPFSDSIHVGSDGWTASVSSSKLNSGSSDNPFGAGVAACLAAAAIFRHVFLDEPLGQDAIFSAFTGDETKTPKRAPMPPWSFDGDAALIGAGAVGQAALWALARAPLSGRLHVVDMEALELSNLQRYVLAKRADEGRAKVELARELESSLELVLCPQDLAAFLTEYGYHWDAMLLGLDSARDRVLAQSSLPRWVGNAWTQAGDLGVSTHPVFGAAGACVSCLYLPEGQAKNEDELVAETLHVPQLQMEIRTLLYNGGPVERALLQAVAEAIGRPIEVLLPFEGRPLRDLYVEGFCGGAVIPLGETGQLQHDATGVHVPLAHQSALAGVLLAAAFAREAAGARDAVTTVTRVDVLKPLGVSLRQPILARRDGRCLCDDSDFVAAYHAKYDFE